MPKVPGSNGTGYVATQGVPGEAPFERASGAAFGQSASLLAQRGFSQIEQTSLQALGHQQAIEADIERHRQFDAAVGGTQTAEEKLNQVENELRFGKTDPTTGAIVEQPASSADYYQRWKQAADAIRQDAVQSTPDQGVAQVLDRSLAKSIHGRSINAQHFAS